MNNKLIFFIFLTLYVCFANQNICCAKKNPECVSGSRAIIIQALDDGALAKICPPFIIYNSDVFGSYNSFCKQEGTLVYLIKNRDYADEDMVKLNKKQCFASRGTYKYINKLGDEKNIRALDIIDKK